MTIKTLRRSASGLLAGLILLAATSPASAVCLCNRRCETQGASCVTAFVSTCLTYVGQGCLLLDCDSPNCYTETFC